MRSTADPSLIVDAAHLWDQPEQVLARFGTHAESDLLLALRRGAALWRRLEGLLGQARPSRLELDDDAVAELLGPVAEQLAGAGIEVVWPTGLVDDGLRLRAVATPAPQRLVESGFGLDSLLAFQWQLTLDGEVLDAEEIKALATAKRTIVRVRGRWLVLDPALLQRLRKPPRTKMPAMEALAAVLAGSAEIDGQTVEVVAGTASGTRMCARPTAGSPADHPTTTRGSSLVGGGARPDQRELRRVRSLLGLTTRR